MKIVGIIQARMGSMRLPGKILKKIGPLSLIEHTISRLKKCSILNEIVIATSVDKKNKILKNIAEKYDVKLFVGNEEDVLLRMLEAGKYISADIVVRICADQPFIDPDIVDNAVKKYIEDKPDLVTTTLKRSFPKGLDVEVFSLSLLDKLNLIVKNNEYRSHVVKYVYDNPETFKIVNLSAPEMLANPKLKLTVDDKYDLEFVREVYDYFNKINFNLQDLSRIFNKKILFRVDGNTELGMGDVVACLNLANELSHYKNMFISKYDQGIHKIKNADYEIKKLETENIAEEISYIKGVVNEFKPDLIITFFADNDEGYLNEISKLGKILNVDFNGNLNVNSDILVNWDILDNKNYNFPDKTIKCFGPDYILLNKELLSYSSLNKQINNSVTEVLITLGGSDLKDLIFKILPTLSKFKVHYSIVIGSSFTRKEELESLLDESGLDYTLYQDIIFLLELMYKSDLAISTGGLTSFELSALGVPFLSIAAVDHQINRLEKMENLGICSYAGNWNEISEKTIFNKFSVLLKSVKLRQSMSIAGKQLVDGKGTIRVGKIIRGLLNENKTNN